MPEDDRNWLGIAVFVVVLVITAFVGAQVMSGLVDYENMNELCTEEYGENYSLVTDSEVLLCEHENGSTAEYPIETQTGAEDVFALWKIVGAVAVMALVIGWVGGLRSDE